MKLDRNRYLETRSIQPKTVLLSLVAVNVLLGFIVWFFPTAGVPIARDQKLKFVTVDQLLGAHDSIDKVVNIGRVLAGVHPHTHKDTTQIAQAEKKEPLGAETGDAIAEPQNTSKLRLPPSNPNALQTLCYALQYESRKKVIRIVHYGDSQLEGDRITSHFRNKMQLTYGGEGPGIVLPKEPAASSRRSAFVTETTNIQKKAIYTKADNPKDDKYGIAGASFSIKGATSSFVEWLTTPSSVGAKKARFTENTQTPAHIQVRVGTSGYARSRTHQKVTLLYGANEPFVVRFQSDTSSHEYVLPASANKGSYTWHIRSKKILKLSFTKGKFPHIYGLALDGTSGVAVDNFAMRGSSAVGFSKMNRNLYGSQLKQMNVRAIVLQYGINLVPNVRSDYSYYTAILVQQLESIQAAHPGVAIIVIGPSDMSRNNGGQMVSYSNVPLIRDAMQAAAMQTGCCFWDLYEAMGGANSMVAWVEKGLAQKDYTHFTSKGAEYIGEMLFHAIHSEINKEKWN